MRKIYTWEITFRFFELNGHDFKNLAVGFGINYGIKLLERSKIDDKWIEINKVKTIKNTDFGLTGKLKANYKNLFGFVRYNLGLGDINNVVYVDENGQPIEGVKQLNRNLQIGIGYTVYSEN